MADFTRRRWTRPRLAIPRRPVDEELNPSSGWTNDFPGFHCLLVNLPGFEEDDIKLNVDESGIIVVSGRRKVDDERQEHFEKTFNVPEDGDVKNIKKIFDGATLRVRIPKVANTEKSKPSSADGASTSNIKTEENKDTNKSALVPSESPASSNDKVEKGKEASDIPALDSIKEKEAVKSKKEAKSPASSNGTKGGEIEEVNSLASGNKQKEIATKSSIIKEDIKGKKSDNSSGDPQGKKGEELESPKENIEKPNEYDPKEQAANQVEEKEHESFKQDEITEKPKEKEQSPKASVLVKIVENKGILLASIISFTLGVLLSQKIHPSST